MTSCLSADDVGACARGELGDDARTIAEVHIDGCASCRIALSEACRGATTEVFVPGLPEPGDVVGRYVIDERLGEGAMGVVFAARDRELARDVAIKVLRPQLGASEHVLVRERMLREGRALARIDHPNVVRVLDVGEWRGSPFVVMERLAGVTLRAWLATAPSAAAIRNVMLQCARGLLAAHGVDVVHRDFKPDNVIVSPDAHARVADFGLAAGAGAASGDLVDDDESPRLTRTHGALGTPAYMAPEQRRGEPVDARSDLYAWCVVATEALPLAAWPVRYRKALRRGLAEDPSERWPSFAEFLAVAAPRRGSRWIAAGALTLAVAAAITIAAARRGGDPCDAAFGWTTHAARAEQAFTTSPSAGAAAAWRYVDGVATRYETSWRGLRRAACRDHEPAIAHCLESRRTEFFALVDRWQPGARDALALAPQAIDALVPVETCRAPDPSPAVDRPELAQRFAAARADRLTGSSARARTELLGLVSLTAEPGFRANLLIELAIIERNLHDPGGARARLVDAIAAAELAGASRTKVVAWSLLAELASQDLMELAQARDALQLATAVVERLGMPGDLSRVLDFVRGLLLIREGRPREALPVLERSMTPETAPTETAHRLLAVARAQLDIASAADAVVSLERAARTLTAALGPNAPGLAAIENAMIDPLRLLQRRDDAVAHGERALALLIAAGEGLTSPFRRAVASNLASVYADAGNLERAIEIQTELLTSATTDYDRGLFETNLGSTLTQAHRHGEALAHLERGRALLGKVLGDDHPAVGNAEHLLALLEIDRAHPDRALIHARRLLAIRERTRAAPGFVATARFLVAELLVDTGRRSDGFAFARTARAEVLGTDDHQLATEIDAFLARPARR